MKLATRTLECPGGRTRVPRPGKSTRIFEPSGSSWESARRRSCSEALRWASPHALIRASSSASEMDGSKISAKSEARTIEGAGDVVAMPWRPRTAPYRSLIGRRISSRIGSRVVSAYQGLCGVARRDRSASTDRRPDLAARYHSRRKASSVRRSMASSLIQATMDGRIHLAAAASGSPTAPTYNARATVFAAISRTRSFLALIPGGKIRSRRLLQSETSGTMGSVM